MDADEDQGNPQRCVTLPAHLHIRGIFHCQFVAEYRPLVLGVGAYNRSQEAKLQTLKLCSGSFFPITNTTCFHPKSSLVLQDGCWSAGYQNYTPLRHWEEAK